MKLVGQFQIYILLVMSKMRENLIFKSILFLMLLCLFSTNLIAQQKTEEKLNQFKNDDICLDCQESQEDLPPFVPPPDNGAGGGTMEDLTPFVPYDNSAVIPGEKIIELNKPNFEKIQPNQSIELNNKKNINNMSNPPKEIFEGKEEGLQPFVPKKQIDK